MPPELPGQIKPHPARHLFSVAGLSLFTVFIIGSFLMASVYLRGLIETNQLAAVITASLVDLANEDRKEDALGTLKVNSVLQAAAQAKANDMAAKGYFAHVSPDGRDSWSWFKAAGYSFSYAGENLAVNFSDSEDVEKAWMDSPTHRANILNGKFTEIGIATAEGEYKGKKTTFVVQMFGRPSGVTAFAPISETKEPVAAEDIAIATTETVPADAVLGSSAPTPAAAAVVPEKVAAEAAAPVVAVEPAPKYASSFDFFASSPQNLLRMIYILSALIVIGALALTTELEFKRHHFRHMVAAAFLLALMGGLFTAADRLVFKAPVIGQAAIAVLG